MQALGNRSVETGAEEMELNHAKAVRSLLDLALYAATERRRVIFFCACPYPKKKGKRACHRALVARLLLREAKRLNESVEIVEWPGGAPKKLTYALKQSEVGAVGSARKSLPVSWLMRRSAVPKDLAYGSILVLTDSRSNSRPLIVGPAFFESEWKLPILAVGQPNQSAGELVSQGTRLRRAFGVEPLDLPKES
jgi:hypothetical protein